MFLRILSIAAVAMLIMLSQPGEGHAQNVSGVFGPTVNADDHNAQYRLTVDPENDVQWAQRFHYERALSDNFRPRVLLATRETNSSEVDIDYIRIEAVWQITPDENSHQIGARFEGRVRFDGAEEIRANLINQWDLGDGWRARAILLNTLQVADKTNDNLQFSSRFGLSRKMPQGYRIGVHGFFDLGDTGGLDILNDQSTSEAGPFISFNISDKTDLYIGTLHGLTEASRDTQLRLMIGQAF